MQLQINLIIGTLVTFFPMTCDDCHFKLRKHIHSSSSSFANSQDQEASVIWLRLDNKSSHDGQGEDNPKVKFDMWNPGTSDICGTSFEILRQKFGGSKRAIGSELLIIAKSCRTSLRHHITTGLFTALACFAC